MKAKEWKQRVERANIDRLTTGKHTDFSVAFNIALETVAYPALRKAQDVTASSTSDSPLNDRMVTEMVDVVRRECGTCPNTVRADLKAWINKTKQRIADRREAYKRHIPGQMVTPHDAATVACMSRKVVTNLLRELIKGTPFEGVEIWVRTQPSSSGYYYSSGNGSIHRLPGTGQKKPKPYAIELHLDQNWWNAIHRRKLSIVEKDGKKGLGMYMTRQTGDQSWGVTAMFLPDDPSRDFARHYVSMSQRTRKADK